MTDLVGIAEIAARAAVEPITVHSWRRRHRDFPAPVVRLAMGPVWRWADIEAWIAAHPRVGRSRPTSSQSVE